MTRIQELCAELSAEISGALQRLDRLSRSDAAGSVALSRFKPLSTINGAERQFVYLRAMCEQFACDDLFFRSIGYELVGRVPQPDTEAVANREHLENGAHGSPVNVHTAIHTQEA